MFDVVARAELRVLSEGTRHSPGRPIWRRRSQTHHESSTARNVRTNEIQICNILNTPSTLLARAPNHMFHTLKEPCQEINHVMHRINGVRVRAVLQAPALVL